MDFVIKIYRKYKEAVDYLFWGGVAFILSMVLFYLFANVMSIYEQIANILSWIVCVIFTYFTNRIFVFCSKVKGIKNIFREFKDFVTARVITLAMENAVLFVMIDLLAINNMVSKFAGQFVVIVSNYFLSKLWIFKKAKK